MAGVRDLVQLPVDGAGKKVDSFSYDLADGRGTVYTNTFVVCNKDGVVVDVLTGDTGQNAHVVAGNRKEVSFTTTTAQAVASTDVSNYSWASVQINTQGTSSVVNFQGSNDNSTWFPIRLGQTDGTLATSDTTAGLYHGPIPARYFRLNVTGISAGTTAGVIEFFSMPDALVSHEALLQDQLGVGIDSLSAGAGMNGLGISMMATNFIVSTNNSSTAPLAAGATYTGTIETIFNQQAVSILVTCDTDATLTLNQYIDLAGTRLISSWPFTIVAGVPFSRCFTGNGNYFNLTLKNNGGSTTTTLNINTAYGTLPAATNLGNQPVSLDEMSGLKLTAFPSGHINMHQDPIQLFYDPYDAALDTAARWSAPATGNSGVAAAVASGAMSLATGTVASGWSYLQSAPTFRSSTPGWVRFASNITIADGAAPTANSFRYWGCGIPQAAPTTAAPVLNGAGFEITTTGKMIAVVYSAGARTAIADLSSTTGNGTQPLDANTHYYQVYYRPTNIYYYIDNALVATATFVQSAIAVDAMSFLYMAVGGATPPSPSAVLSSHAVSVSDTAQNSTTLSDGTFSWRKATVSSTGLLSTADQGMAATGASLVGNPVRIGGSDGSLAQDVNVTAKAVQGTRGLAVQDLKDAGRTSVMVTAQVASTATAETLISINKSLGLAATGASTSTTITSGKRFRIQAIVASVANTTGTVASNVTLRIRAAVGGATSTSSPLQFLSTVPLAASAVATLFPDALIPDGFEIDSNSGTNTWGVTITHPQWVTGTQVATFNVCIVGYEY